MGVVLEWDEILELVWPWGSEKVEEDFALQTSQHRSDRLLRDHNHGHADRSQAGQRNSDPRR